MTSDTDIRTSPRLRARRSGAARRRRREGRAAAGRRRSRCRRAASVRPRARPCARRSPTCATASAGAAARFRHARPARAGDHAVVHALRRRRARAAGLGRLDRLCAALRRRLLGAGAHPARDLRHVPSRPPRRAAQGSDAGAEPERCRQRAPRRAPIEERAWRPRRSAMAAGALCRARALGAQPRRSPGAGRSRADHAARPGGAAHGAGRRPSASAWSPPSARWRGSPWSTC